MSSGCKIYIYFFLGLLLSAMSWLAFFFMVIYLDKSYFIEWELYFYNSSLMSVSLIFDWMSCLFMFTVCLISSGISLYSMYYMSEEDNYIRFFFILFFFMCSMGFLIISPNLISLLLGWDGLGLTSYALIIFYQSESSGSAGMLTILSNRIGDVAILISIGLVLVKGGWNFIYLDDLGGSLVVSLIILAGLTKSAQMPFSAWLPAAMAAPTPVSALVHSSTLVTAGVYLLIRFSEVVNSSGLGKYLFYISIMTMFMAGLSANFEMDLKKVIALSTLSQLGLMMMILSAGCSELAFFHLISHAMFKSTLFMCSGCIIHESGGWQDLRTMSGLVNSSPLLSVVLNIVNMALCGVPFLAGYYSKDLILEVGLGGMSGFASVILVGLATGLTVSYSLRLLYSSLDSSGKGCSLMGSGDMNMVVIISVSGLLFSSVISGFVLSWVVVPSADMSVVLGFSLKYLVFIVSFIFSVGVFFEVSEISNVYNSMLILIWLKKSLSQMWFMPNISGALMGSTYLYSGELSFKNMDGGWIEFYGSGSGHKLVMNMGSLIQTGQKSIVVSSYLVSIYLMIMVAMYSVT
uniref:NADH-ubiquinone oxidoreductase chain 5 n=1 Tax=Pseudocrangonyx daejeonensis TaxID=2038767 RepID=A0A346SAF5_9CRUS|nr:NADH dehydrogenase subunit 5 [Pseudocrangonyx daejeonensis]AXT17543.1 NADH dehydrogenase subunit 5 [Pseudocrangonyx daejeonensis]